MAKRKSSCRPRIQGKAESFLQPEGIIRPGIYSPSITARSGGQPYRSGGSSPYRQRRPIHVVIRFEAACVGHRAILVPAHVSVPALGETAGGALETELTSGAIPQGDEFFGAESGFVAVAAGR